MRIIVMRMIVMRITETKCEEAYLGTAQAFREHDNDHDSMNMMYDVKCNITMIMML